MHRCAIFQSMIQALLIPHPQKRDYRRTQASFPGWGQSKALFRCFWPELADSLSAGQCCGNQSCIDKVPLFIRGKGFQIGLGILIIQFSGLLKVFHGLFCFTGQQINPAAAIDIQAILGFQLKGFVD